jgi:hypothetical protein
MQFSSKQLRKAVSIWAIENWASAQRDDILHSLQASRKTPTRLAALFPKAILCA